jgi:hypothetical protein
VFFADQALLPVDFVGFLPQIERGSRDPVIVARLSDVPDPLGVL